MIKLTADNIKLEGLITANGNVKITEEGNLEAVNGKFEGEVKATSGSFGVMTFSGEIYDSSVGRIRFGTPDTSYTVISTSESELGRNANIYLYNEIGNYGIVSTAPIALWAIGDVQVEGDITAKSLDAKSVDAESIYIGGKKLTLTSKSIFDGADGEGNPYYTTITYLTLV